MPPDPPGQPDTSARIVFLDYLRIFAFASVLAGHKFAQPVQAAAAQPGWAGAPARLLWPFIEGGGAGVVVFFLVSGYIITQVLQRESAGVFLVRRAFRIYPLYILAVLAEWHFMQRGTPARALLAQLLLIGDFTQTPHALAGVEWTLRLEMLFYLCMAAARACGWVQPARARTLLAACAALALALHLGGPFTPYSSGLLAWARGYISLYLPFLFIGSAFWLLERRAIAWPLALGYIAWVFALYYAGLRAWQPHWLHAPFAALAVGLFALLWAVRRRLPARPAVLALSELTYAIYLTHNWLYDELRRLTAQSGLPGPAATAAALALLLALCALLTHAIERPGVRLGRKLSKLIEKQANPPQRP